MIFLQENHQVVRLNQRTRRYGLQENLAQVTTEERFCEEKSPICNTLSQKFLACGAGNILLTTGKSPCFRPIAILRKPRDTVLEPIIQRQETAHEKRFPSENEQIKSVTHHIAARELNYKENPLIAAFGRENSLLNFWEQKNSAKFPGYKKCINLADPPGGRGGVPKS